MPGLAEPAALGFPALVLIGALLNLDKQVLGPFMVGRPLVTGLIMGLAAGEIVSGIWLGLSAELLWMTILPLGGQITPHAGLAVSAALIAWKTGGFAPAAGTTPDGFVQATLVIAFLTIPVWARAMGLVDLLGRRLAPASLAKARADLAGDREPRFLRRNLHGLAATLALSAAVLSAAVLVNTEVLKLATGLAPPAALYNLGFLYNLVPFIGLLGMAVFMGSKFFPFYLGGLLAGLLVLSAV